MVDKTNNQRFPQGRHFMALGMFLLALLLYIDRVCISVAKDPVAGDLGLSDKAMGWVLSIFALGYALFQVPGGRLADRFGPRLALTSIVTFWSALTALTGAVWNSISLLLVRFFFGAGEAGAFPGMSRAIFSWIPLKERGLITGINFSGSRLGAAFALPFVAWLIDAYGWRMTFGILGVIGAVWAVGWWVLFRDDPMEHSAISEAEKEYIKTHRQQTTANTKNDKLPLRQLFSSPNMWMTMVQYFCSNFTFFFALTWLFPYLKSKYQLDAMEAGFYASAPFIFGAIGNWLAGWLVDYIYKQGRWNASRSLTAMIGFGLAAVGLIGSIYMDTALGAVIFLSLAILGADMTLPPSWTLCVDIGKQHAGTVSGAMNMAGNIGSFITALAFPYLQAWTGSVTPFFFLGAALNVLGVILWSRIRADQPLSVLTS
ncbi:MAG: MFS transporter [Saprospiraceae bacterium]|nr:MFS transporter [Saprospiraceae bacterium]